MLLSLSKWLFCLATKVNKDSESILSKSDAVEEEKRQCAALISFGTTA